MISNFIAISFRFSYVVREGKYLIKDKPVRPISSFARFNKSVGKNQIGNPAIRMQQNSKQWKSLSEAEKASYKTPNEQLLKYRKEKEEYEVMYVLPFKIANYSNLLLKQISKDNKGQAVDFKNYSQRVKKAFINIEPSEKQALKKKAQEINAERAKLIEKFKIPLDEYNGRLSNFVQRVMNKYMKDLKKPQIEECTKKYNLYLAKKKEQFEEFAIKHGLTPGKLQLLIKTDARRTAKSLKDKDQQKNGKKETKQKEKSD